MLLANRVRAPPAEASKELRVEDRFVRPRARVDRHERVEALRVDVEPAKVHAVPGGDVSERGRARRDCPLDPSHDPVENADVLPKSGPQKVAVALRPEP